MQFFNRIGIKRRQFATVTLTRLGMHYTDENALLCLGILLPIFTGVGYAKVKGKCLHSLLCLGILLPIFTGVGYAKVKGKCLHSLLCLGILLPIFTGVGYAKVKGKCLHSNCASSCHLQKLFSKYCRINANNFIKVNDFCFIFFHRIVPKTFFF